MFERFTDASRRVLVLAQEEARHLGHNFLGTEHLLLGLIHEGDGVAAKALESVGVSHEVVRVAVVEIVGPGQSSISGAPPFTTRAKKVLELSLRESLQLGHNYIGTEHMLLGVVREGEGVAARALVSLGIDLHRVRQEVIVRLSGASADIERRGAVAGDLVEKTDITVGASALLDWEDASALLRSSPLVAEARTERSEVDGITYETCTYHPRLLPEISLAVAGALVTPEAFDDYTDRALLDAEEINGLGDAATYSVAQGSLRVLVGSTVLIIKVRRHPHPRDAAIEVAMRAVARISRSSQD